MHQWIKDHRLPIIAFLFWVVTAIMARGWMQLNTLTFSPTVSIGASLETSLEAGDFALQPMYLLLGVAAWVISLLITRLVKYWYVPQDDTLNQSSSEGVTQ